MKDIKLETICLGHITKSQSPANWCYGCFRDDKNQHCPHYIPVKMYEIEIPHAQKLYDKRRVEDHFDNFI